MSVPASPPAAPVSGATPNWSDIVRSEMWQCGRAECGCATYQHVDHEGDEYAGEPPILATLHDSEICSDGLDVAHVPVGMRAALRDIAVPAGVPVLAVDRAMLAAALRGLPADGAGALAAVAAEREAESEHAAMGVEAVEAYLKGWAEAEDEAALDAANHISYAHLPIDGDPAATWFATTLNPLDPQGEHAGDDLRRRAEARVRHEAALAGEVATPEAVATRYAAVEAALAAAEGMMPVAPTAPVAFAPVVVTDVTDGGDAIARVAAEAQAALEHASEPALLDSIFCTPELAAQREFSRLSLVSPMVGLMADLSAMLAMIPPTVTLPPIIGKPSGFNFLHSPVGPSGAGKGGATDVSVIIHTSAGEGLPRVQGAVGSGEVLASKFTKVSVNEDGSKEAEVHTPSVRLYWSEITKIAAVKGRSGSTIGPELCQAWSSEELGSDTKSQTSFAEAHTYRLTAAIAAQLATIALLFDPASALMGLSQRLWLVSAVLTEIPAPGTPEWDALIDAEVIPNPRYVTIPHFKPGQIHVEKAVWREVRELRLQAQLNPRPDAALETHMNLMRLRIAAGAAMLHNEPPAVTMRWWRWTDHMAEHHRRVRRAGQIAARIATTTGAVEAGEFDAVRADARAMRQHCTALDAQRRWCAKQPGAFAYRDAQQGTKAGTYRRENLQSLLDELVARGELLTFLVERVPRYLWVRQQT